MANPEHNNSFSERLKTLLKQKGMSQSDLAREAGILRDRVSYYVKGGMPRRDKLNAIARALGTTVTDLMGANTEELEMAQPAKEPQFAVHDGTTAGRKRLRVDMELRETAVAQIMEILLREMSTGFSETVPDEDPKCD